MAAASLGQHVNQSVDTLLHKAVSLWVIGSGVHLVDAHQLITNHASRLVCRNDPEIKWPPQCITHKTAQTPL